MIPGIVKRLGEIQGQSFLDQNNWRGVRIIRPANVFGPHDDFNIKTGQVIPSLITKIFKKDKKIEVWGDGKAKRDFIFSEDVAKAIIRVLYSKNVNSQPLNFGSGKAVSIKFLVKKILKISKQKKIIKWKKNAPIGDKVRILSMKNFNSKIKNFNFTDLETALIKTIEWYKKNKNYV